MINISDNSHIMPKYNQLVELAEEVAGMVDEYNMGVDKKDFLFIPELRMVPWGEGLIAQRLEKEKHLNICGIQRRKWEVMRVDRWSAQPRITDTEHNESDGSGV